MTAALWLSACAVQEQGQAGEPGVETATRNGPPGADIGTCWGRTVTPAVVQTVEKQVEVTPAEVNADGTIAAAPTYRTERRQEIVSPRRDNWFETPCPETLTPEFVASLQRALIARQLFAGEANGVFDVSTRTAVRAYQVSIGGPDSPVMSIETARSLGLIAVPRQP
ncbi:MAG: peptidoglycan-binding domain-containing protein [Pseudomonadota bacterium]